MLKYSSYIPITIMIKGNSNNGMLFRDYSYLLERNFNPKLGNEIIWTRGEFTLVFENQSRILLKDESGLTIKVFTKAKHAYKFIRKIERASVSNLKF